MSEVDLLISRLRLRAIISSSKVWLGLSMAMTGACSASCGCVWVAELFLSCVIRRRDPKLTKDGFGAWTGLVGGFDVLAGAKGSKLRSERKDGMDETGVCGKAKVTEVEAGLGWMVLSDVRRNWDTRDV